MITLKEYFLKDKKENIYSFYSKLFAEPKKYDQITRLQMYEQIISKYEDNPEIILDLCSVEELQLLKNIIDKENLQNHGYIEYLLFSNLQNNYLILKDKEYYIPSDLINYVKMAFNLLDKQAFSYKDVVDSVFIGIIRIYNVITYNEAIAFLREYNISMTEHNLEIYIRDNPKFNSIIYLARYKKKKYIVSKEFFYYKDILNLKKDYIRPKIYKLEEVISIGKYKINLFQEEIFEFLSFLEVHLDSIYIDQILNEIILYMGFDLQDEKALENMADYISPLYEKMKKVIPFFPVWIYNGNDLKSIKRNIKLPKKNEPCLCGSGKKFKSCCMAKFRGN